MMLLEIESVRREQLCGTFEAQCAVGCSVSRRFHPGQPAPARSDRGGAALYRGYRARFRGTQNAAQERRQERTAQRSPAAEVEAFLWRAIALLQARGVRVLVTIPPLRDRPSALFDPDAAAAPYHRLRSRLQKQGVTVLPVASGYAPAEFINAGHLNDRGAQRFSAELGRQLAARDIP